MYSILSLKPDDYINTGSDLSSWSSLECVVHACMDNEKKKSWYTVHELSTLITAAKNPKEFYTGGFIKIFCQRATSFHKWSKLIELNFFVRKAIC